MPMTIHSYTCPDNRKEWKISVGISNPIDMSLTYVPDKLIADHNSIKNYLRTYAQKKYDNPEEMLLNIIEGVNNELVPKWLRIAYKHDNVEIELEDQQPGLKNFPAHD